MLLVALWTAVQASRCAGHYGQNLGDAVCCGESGAIMQKWAICPKSNPICKGFKQNVKWGKCTMAKSLRALRHSRPRHRQPTSSCGVERSVDYYGGDFKAIMNVESAEKCAQLCGQNPGCKSWTWGKKINQPYYKKCHLKNGATERRENDDCCDSGLPCISGCEVERSMDYHGGDFKAILNVDTALECARLCGSHPRCKSWTWGKNKSRSYYKKCHLKDREVSSKLWQAQRIETENGDSGLACTSGLGSCDRGEKCEEGYCWKSMPKHSCWGAFQQYKMGGETPTKKQCQEYCASNGACHAVEYEKGGQGCEVITEDASCPKMSPYKSYDIMIKKGQCSNDRCPLGMDAPWFLATSPRFYGWAKFVRGKPYAKCCASSWMKQKHTESDAKQHCVSMGMKWIKLDFSKNPYVCCPANFLATTTPIPRTTTPIPRGTTTPEPRTTAKPAPKWRKIKNAQCVIMRDNQRAEEQYHNPIWHIGERTLEDCKKACASQKDSKGRKCVAIEIKDGGKRNKMSAKMECAMAWECKATHRWSSGSVYLTSEALKTYTHHI